MKIIFFVLVLLTPAIFATAQNKGKALSIDSALSYLKENYPQEKVFLQTDKGYYFPGETIWMKAWCTTDGAPTFLSRILYVDLVNTEGEVVQKKMYRLDSLGSTPADMDLPADIKSGNYTVNAYTLWMLNFPAFVFHRPVFIYNVEDYKTSPPPAAPSLKLQFFAEGGDLIGGVKNRMAFKAVDNDGLPVEVKGDITDKAGAKLTAFATEHDGMGAFEINPGPDNNYTANVTTANGRLLTFRLPAVKEEGIALGVENSNPNRLFVFINRAEKNKSKYNTVTLVAQMYNQVIFKTALNIDEGQTTAPISKKNLPAGIMQITVFDAEDNPLAERLVFIENYTLHAPVINLDTINTKARGKNQFSFSINDVQATSLSCLVTSDLMDTLTCQENNIAASFLLTTDIPGYIHHPGYYFKDKTAPTLHHLDLLLMTQGWRRFEWKKILQHDFATLHYPVESAISFRGTVTKSDRKMPVTDGRVSFIIKGEDSTSILADATLTDKGEFLLDNVNYMKRATVSYMGTNNKKENFIVDVKLVPSYIDSLKKSANIPVVNLDTINIANRKNSMAAYYIYGRMMQADSNSPFRKAKVLQEVTINARKLSHEDSLNREYAGGPFLMGKSIDPASVKFARSIWQIIQQSVPGITVEGNPFDPVVTMNRFGGLGTENTASLNGAESSDGSISQNIVMESNGIAYYLNEVNVSKDVINSLSVDDVALIKVLKNEAAALGASQGAIIIYTKKGVVAGKAPYEKTYTSEKREGYAVTRQFYTPDYSAGAVSHETDKRNTLYWNGKLSPGRNGKYRFRFFNNDTGRKFKLTIQGIDRDGNFIYTEHILR